MVAISDPGPASESALVLARELGLSFTAADVLVRRGREAGDELRQWLDPKLAHLTPPTDMADLEAASDRIARGIRNGERIVVFGDYDCDGITSAAIMTEVIAALGGDVRTELASRFAGGYGFSAPALQRVQAAGASLLVTCDCGSSDHERLHAARKVGIDSVVIDHHLVPDEALPAVAFLNPHRPECGFPYKGLASCGLALVVATALRKALSKELDVRRWLDLVAVGTIADVAPLDGDNRALVRAGLRVLGQGSRIGLRALSVNGNRGKVIPPTAEDVAYQIAPRLNAPGRLGDPRLALDVLLARDPAQAWSLADSLEQQTLKRRELQREIIAQAIQQIADRGYADDPGIVLADPGWHPGIVGIVAGRVADQYQKPTIVVALEGSRGRGSARAPNGYRIYDALQASRDALLGFGGHQAAAGIDIAADRVAAFRAAWNAACRDQAAALGEQPSPHQPEVRLDARDDPMQVVVDLERMEPCGEANPSPKLWFERVTVVEARAIRDHLKLGLQLGSHRLSAFAPDQGHLETVLTEGREVGVVGRLRRDRWRGGDAAEILVDLLTV